MLFNTPQYIDVEDKIIGPLTGKQLMWLAGMGVILLILWFTIESKAVFFVAGFPIALIFLAFAFYRPYNQTLLSFILHALNFLSKPKIYVWKRTADLKKVSVAKKEVVAPKQQKKMSYQDIEALSHLADTEGEMRDKRAVEMITKAMQAKQK